MAIDALGYEGLKKYAWRLEINGYPVALIQEVNPGAAEIGLASRSQGGMNFDVKEAGKLKFQELTFKSFVPLDGPGKTYLQKWLDKAQDPVKGYGMRKKDYAQDFSLYDLMAMDNVIRVWTYVNGWLQKYDPGDRNSNSDKDFVIESGTIAYDYRVMVER